MTKTQWVEKSWGDEILVTVVEGGKEPEATMGPYNKRAIESLLGKTHGVQFQYIALLQKYLGGGTGGDKSRLFLFWNRLWY